MKSTLKTGRITSKKRNKKYLKEHGNKDKSQYISLRKPQFNVFLILCLMTLIGVITCIYGLFSIFI